MHQRAFESRHLDGRESIDMLHYDSVNHVKEFRLSRDYESHQRRCMKMSLFLDVLSMTFSNLTR